MTKDNELSNFHNFQNFQISFSFLQTPRKPSKSFSSSNLLRQISQNIRLPPPLIEIIAKTDLRRQNHKWKVNWCARITHEKNRTVNYLIELEMLKQRRCGVSDVHWSMAREKFDSAWNFLLSRFALDVLRRFASSSTALFKVERCYVWSENESKLHGSRKGQTDTHSDTHTAKQWSYW